MLNNHPRFTWHRSIQANPMKILAIQFKYLGDAVFITPSLKALHQQYPEAEIHVLVAEEVLPVFRHIPFIKKAWGLPRTRGKAKLTQTLPFLSQLRKEKFLESKLEGYESFYLIPDGSNLETNDDEIVVTGKVNSANLAKAFMKFNKTSFFGHKNIILYF